MGAAVAIGWAMVTTVITEAAARAPDTTRLTGCERILARVSFADRPPSGTGGESGASPVSGARSTATGGARVGGPVPGRGVSAAISRRRLIDDRGPRDLEQVTKRTRE